MRVNNCRDDYIDMSKFGSVFADKITQETMDSLKNYAAEGDRHSIELLNNLALRQDQCGRDAENILFNLLIGKTRAHKNIAENIQRTALMLYQLSLNSKMQNNTDMYKLRHPSRLLYIAGSAANCDERLTLSQIFIQCHHPDSKYPHIDETDIWDPARMLSGEEVNSGLIPYTRNFNTPQVNSPVALIHSDDNVNTLSLQIASRIASYKFLDRPEFFPVHTGTQWIVFGLSKASPGVEPRAVVFNSANPLDPTVKKALLTAAKIAGVTPPENIQFLENNIQTHVPNGCGLFTIEIIRQLMGHDFQTSVGILQTFLSSFDQFTVEEQQRYNLQRRYHIYAETYLNSPL